VPERRLLYTLSLLVLACLAAGVLLRLAGGRGVDAGRERRAQLIRTDSGWVLQVDLVNNEEGEILYRVVATQGGRVRDSQGVLLEAGQRFRYSHYFNFFAIDPEGKGELAIAIYKGDGPAPVAENIFFLH